MPDIDLSPDFDSLRKLVDEINKDKDKSDQIDYKKLTELARAKLILGNLKPIESTELESEYYSNKCRQSRTRHRDRANAKVSKNKDVLNKTINVIDKLIEGLKEPKKGSDEPKKGVTLGPPGPGERFAIAVEESDIKNTYNNIKYLENKLKDNNLTVAEYKKPVMILIN